MFWMTLAWGMVAIGVIGLTVSLVFSERRDSVVATSLAATTLCDRCSFRLPKWFVGPHGVCLHCVSYNKYPYPVEGQTEKGYMCLRSGGRKPS